MSVHALRTRLVCREMVIQCPFLWQTEANIQSDMFLAVFFLSLSLSPLTIDHNAFPLWIDHFTNSCESWPLITSTITCFVYSDRPRGNKERSRLGEQLYCLSGRPDFLVHLGNINERIAILATFKKWLIPLYIITVFPYLFFQMIMIITNATIRQRHGMNGTIRLHIFITDGTIHSTFVIKKNFAFNSVGVWCSSAFILSGLLYVIGIRGAKKLDMI